MRALARVAPVALALCVVGCAGSTDGSARAVAERFLDQHYVRIDLEAARTLTEGLATAKIDKEIELTSEIEIDAETRQPSIYYSLDFAEEAGDVASFQYHLQISAGGVSPYLKLVLLTVRRTDAGWRVTNYSEADPP